MKDLIFGVAKKCPSCKFIASAITMPAVYEALFVHYEAMHPKDPA